MAMFGFPHWQLKSTSTESGVVAPDERLPFAQTAISRGGNYPGGADSLWVD